MCDQTAKHVPAEIFWQRGETRENCNICALLRKN